MRYPGNGAAVPLVPGAGQFEAVQREAHPSLQGHGGEQQAKVQPGGREGGGAQEEQNGTHFQLRSIFQ